MESYRALWTGVQTEESITVTGIIVLVMCWEVLVIHDEEEVPVEEPAAPEAAGDEEVPAAPEAIPDAARPRVLQRCMA